MALSALADRSHQPDPAQLATLLGPAAAAWSQLVAAVSAQHAPIVETWNFGGEKNGWSLRLRRGDRIVAYLIPQSRHFLVGLVLGERAVKTVQAERIPAPVRKLIDAAPVYAEGRGVRLPIRNVKDVAAVLKLVAAKLAR